MNRHSKLIAALIASCAAAAAAAGAGAGLWALIAAALPPLAVYFAPANVESGT